MNFAFFTLGCKANQFDTQAMETLLRARGHKITGPARADVCVVNTCTVTGEADRKCRQTVRRVRRKHPDAFLAVCGCMCQIDPDAARNLGADVVGGSGDRAGFLDAIERAYRSRTPEGTVSAHTRAETFEMLPAGSADGRTRALLKVEDGCDNYCSYCIIPYARGHVRSMPIPDAVRETVRLRNEGFRECVVTGIEISSYGRDLPDTPTLTDLICALCDAAGDMRVHLGSLEPRTVDRSFCEKLSGYANLCPHFHLSLQSGCDATLSRMHRRYTTARFLESVTLLREYFDNCLITTDLITGFPGETEDEFRETLAFLETVRFGTVHIFPYSERTGTTAAALPQLPHAVREERARRASEIAQKTKADFLASQLGRTLDVLFETSGGGVWTGHAQNYVEVYVISDEPLHNVRRPVQVTGVRDDGVTGVLI